MLWRFLMGISGAALYSSTVKQLLAVAPSRGTAMGVLQSGAGAGMIVGLVGLPLMAAAAGVHSAFWAMTALTAAACVYAAVCLPAAAAPHRAVESMRAQVGGIVRDRLFHSIASCTALVLFSVYGITAWIPTYLQTEYRFTSAAAGGVAALINVGLAVASPAAGALSDRLGVRGPVVVAGVALLVLACVLLAAVHGAPAVALAAVVAGIGIALTLPILTTMTTDAFGMRRAERCDLPQPRGRAGRLHDLRGAVRRPPRRDPQLSAVVDRRGRGCRGGIGAGIRAPGSGTARVPGRGIIRRRVSAGRA